MADDAVVPLRLPGSRSGTPDAYLRLEDALNAIGQLDHATEWGRLPGWSQMPFRWQSKTRQHVRHELRLFGRRARLQRIPVTLELTKAEKQVCVQIYRQVRGVIREALEQGRLHALAVHHVTGEVTSIKALGIWRMQAGPIFFTGHTVLRDPDQPDQPDRLADVVLERKLFERWLADRAKAKARTASVKMLRDAGAVIAEHCKQHTYKISRPEAKALVTAIALKHDKVVSGPQFGTYVWKPLGATAGRRRNKHQTLYKEHEAGLKTRLEVVFGGASGT